MQPRIRISNDCLMAIRAWLLARDCELSDGVIFGLIEESALAFIEASQGAPWVGLVDSHPVALLECDGEDYMGAVANDGTVLARCDDEPSDDYLTMRFVDPLLLGKPTI